MQLMHFSMMFGVCACTCHNETPNIIEKMHCHTSALAHSTYPPKMLHQYKLTQAPGNITHVHVCPRYNSTIETHVICIIMMMAQPPAPLENYNN